MKVSKNTREESGTKKPRKILLVDDDPFVLESYSNRLKDEGFKVTALDSGWKALEVATKQHFDLIIADVRLPGMDGIQTIEKIKKTLPKIKSILITAYADEKAPIRAIHVDVDEYILKPVEDDAFLSAVRNVLMRLEIEEAQQEHLLSQQKRFYDFDTIIGNSKKIVEVLRQVKVVSNSDFSVLLLGETGTGKELVARAIHYNSDRRNEKFVAINCAEIPDNLIQSELFGYERHAFTGAVERRIGNFDVANGGTIFLDEIGELNSKMQGNLLRILQEKKFRRVGGTKEITVNVRVLAATTFKDLLREDLYHRFRVKIILPPLRERKEDIAGLVMHFIKKFATEYNRQPNIANIEEEAMKRLMQYDWRGNVRELENAVSNAVLFSQNGVIKSTDLSLPKIPESAVTEDKPSHANQLETIQAVIKRHIEYVLSHSPSKRKAAKILGMHPSTLNDWIKKYQVSLP